jgi:mono/diheme cytochrome c family protein
LNKLYFFSAFLIVAAGVYSVGHFSNSFDHGSREGQSEVASLSPAPFAAPVIQRITDEQGRELWRAGQKQEFSLEIGQVINLEGENFGNGPEVDLSKVVIGKVRALERDLTMMLGETKIHIKEFPHLNRVQYVENLQPEEFGGETWPQVWKKDLISWSPKKISFRVPATASQGPIVVQVQKKTTKVQSLVDSSKAHLIPDPIFERVLGDLRAEPSLTVDSVGPAVLSNAVPVQVHNEGFAAAVKRGEALYWAFDYNMGLTQHLVHIDWENMLAGKLDDPFEGGKFNAVEKIGAIPITRDQVIPEIARSKYDFIPSPMPMPIKSVLTKRRLENVHTFPTQYVGYVWADSIDPFRPLGAKNYIGFNCASCHAREISYEASPGKFVKQVFPGIPNNKWSMKFAALGDVTAVRGGEANPDTVKPSATYGHFNLVSGATQEEKVDKSPLLYYLNPGTADMTMVRTSLEKYTFYKNDFFYSPTAISIITRHTPLRRALSRTEAIAGFEGSYIHAQEPDGALGAISKKSMQDFTSFMSTLDQNDPLLVKIGLYEWLKKKNKLGDIGSASQADFIRNNYNTYPELAKHLRQGKQVFDQACLKCHQSNFGTYTDENMMALKDIGSYFSPTAWIRQMGAIRTAPLRDMYWVQARGLLHDGHLRVPANAEDKDFSDSLQVLVQRERCDQNSPLYKKLYTLNESSFRIPKGTPAQERAIRQQHYFVDLPNATADQSKYLYWDYQSMRNNFGKLEYGANTATPLPATPHPYCVTTAQEADDLVYYLLSL